MSKFFNISTDNTLGGNTPSDVLVASQKAIKEYVDSQGGGGGSGGYHPDLFDWKWADHICNDVQWLRADTFSWQSGAVYQAAYQHLADDIDGKTLQSETISGTTVQFYLADNGHKICPASEESNVSAIYTATGMAWYYILDTVNQRFKLPRGKHNKYTETLGVVGNGLVLGLTNGTDTAGTTFNSNTTSINPNRDSYGLAVSSSGTQTGNGLSGRIGVTPDSTKSGLVTTSMAQETDQYKYLYFYVGNFTQTAIENTAGLNAELFNDKADIDLNNVSAGIDFVVESQLPSAGNNYTWYRKYKSGWVEQGGFIDIGSDSTSTGIQIIANLPITMANAMYYKNIMPGGNTSGGSYMGYSCADTTNSTITTLYGYWIKTETSVRYFYWEVKGIAA